MLGVVEVLKLLTGPGDAVVVNSPVYPPFFHFVGHLGRRVVEAPLTPGGRIDLATLEQALGEATRGGGRAAYLLCNPQNPTGAVHTPQELTAVLELADSLGVRVVADEIHAPVVPAGATFTPVASLPAGRGRSRSCRPRRRSTSPGSRRPWRSPAPRPPPTWPASPRRSPTAPATWG